MMTTKYLFQDWLSGTIILKYADLFYNSKTTKSPTLVDYSDFDDFEAAKVKTHQQSLFKTRVTELVSGFGNEFTSNRSESQAQELLTVHTIDLINEILFGTHYGIEFTTFEFRNLTFLNSHLRKIRDFASQTIIGGIEYQYENIQIDNSPYTDHSYIQPEVYSQALWEHLKNLKKISSRRGPQTETNWFKIGLLIANGEMEKLIEQHQSNFHSISREIGMPKSRPYISESLGGGSYGGKNIFTSPKKIAFIKEYCEENNITISALFLQREAEHVLPRKQ
jgi:hypothetical protein